MTLAQPLLDVLLPAYAPCSGFKATCRAMRWVPHQGHVPRGFCGAAGRLDEVRLVLVCAEPGDPHDGESHAADGTAEGQLRSAYGYAWRSFENGKDL